MPTHNEQGTGKHGHKDTEEPYPHTKEESGGTHAAGHASRGHSGSDSSSSHGSSRDGGSGREGHSAAGRQDDESLERREYKDAQGNEHHHTKTYMEQHGDEKK